MATRKRFTKALVLRLCAVGLFICLGTFAVMHSIQNQKKKDTDETAQASQTETEDVTKVPVTTENDEVTTVSGIDDSSKAAAVPPFQTTRPSGSSGYSMGDTTSPPGTDSKGGFQPPPFRPAGSSGDAKTSFAGGTTTPPTRPGSFRPPQEPRTGGTPKMDIPPLAGRTTPPPSTGNTPALPPRQPSPGGGGFSATPGNGNNLLPPIRPAAQGNGSNPKSDIPPLRPGTTGAGGSTGGSFGDQTSTPGSRPPVIPVRPSGAAAAGAAAIGGAALGAAATPPASPFGGTQSQNGSSRTTTPPTTSSTLPPLRPAPGTQQNQPGTRQNQNTAAPSPIRPGTTPPRNNPAQIRNANTTVTSPRAQNIAAPLNSSTTTNSNLSSMARPTPGPTEQEGVQLPALAVQKIAPPEIQVNREATFELIVKNTGRAAADNVQVHDFVPQGTRLIEAMPEASPGPGGRISWNLGTLNPGQQVSIKMKLLPERAGNIGSVAHVTLGAQASAQTVCTQPQLAIRHEAPTTVLIGQDVLLNIFVENKGNGAAENVVLQEDVPDGLDFAGGQRELEYPIGTLRPGESRNIQLRLRAAKVGQVRNVLVAHGAGKLQATDNVDVRIIAPQLSLQGEGPNRKFLNRPAKHSFTVANLGTAAATNMQLVAQLPRGLQFVEANNSGQYDRNNHAVVWRLAQLDPQKNGTVQLTTMPVTTGQHEINVTASADLNQREQTTQTLSVQQLSELYFDIDDTADAIEVGTGTTYNVRVVNQGRIPANNVRIQVDFAQALQPVSVQGSVRNQINGQSVVLEPITALQPGQEILFTISANATAPGDHRTVVKVRSDDREAAVSKEESTHVYADR
ncbi:MAG: hypothetical protein ACR2NP_13150 [Pirellulaceae bacterium]